MKKLIKSKYAIFDKDDFCIYAVKHECGKDNRISVYPSNDDWDTFLFQKSKPETLKAIGKLFIEAAEV